MAGAIEILESVRSQSLSHDARKWDVSRSISDGLKFIPKGDAVQASVLPDLLFSAGAFDVQPYAYRQICSKLGIPYKYLQKCPADLAVANLEHWRGLDDTRSWLIRGIDKSIRAALTTEYYPISNTYVLDRVISVVQESVQGGVPYTLVDPAVTPDALHLKLGLAGKDAYMVGVYVSNGEIGNRTIKVAPFVQRTACNNSFLFLEDGYIRRHWKISMPILEIEFKMAMLRALEDTVNLVLAMELAKSMKIKSLQETVASVCAHYGFTQDVHDLMITGAEGSHTVMGLANGISYAAQAVGVEQRVDMEALAGHVVRNPALHSFPTLEDSDE